jgi:hypothetical protein
VTVTCPAFDEELDLFPVARQHVELTPPQNHALSKIGEIRLLDLVEIRFIRFPKRRAPEVYDISQRAKETARTGEGPCAS